MYSNYMRTLSPIIIIALILSLIAVLSFYFLIKKGYNMNQSTSSTTSVEQSSKNVVSASYGEKTTYGQSITLKFPDFDLIFTGTERSPWPSKTDNKDLYLEHYLFTLEKDGVEKSISWSSGTGLVVPLPFEFSDKKYTIILPSTSNELIITQK